MKLISESDDSDQGEESGEKIIDELVSSTALIVKRYEGSKSNGVRRT